MQLSKCVSRFPYKKYIMNVEKYIDSKIYYLKYVRCNHVVMFDVTVSFKFYYTQMYPNINKTYFAKENAYIVMISRIKVFF